MLQHMASRIGAEITTVPGSHALFITQAETVADVIVTASRSVSSAAPVAHAAGPR